LFGEVLLWAPLLIPFGIPTPLFSTSETYLIPIVAVFWGLVDGERLSFVHYLSMSIIICGVYLANKKL